MGHDLDGNNVPSRRFFSRFLCRLFGKPGMIVTKPHSLTDIMDVCSRSRTPCLTWIPKRLFRVGGLGVCKSLLLAAAGSFPKAKAGFDQDWKVDTLPSIDCEENMLCASNASKTSGFHFKAIDCLSLLQAKNG